MAETINRNSVNPSTAIVEEDPNDPFVKYAEDETVEFEALINEEAESLEDIEFDVRIPLRATIVDLIGLEAAILNVSFEHRLNVIFKEAIYAFVIYGNEKFYRSAQGFSKWYGNPEYCEVTVKLNLENIRLIKLIARWNSISNVECLNRLAATALEIDSDDFVDGVI